MKKSEIEVGQEYSYGSQGGGSRQRVKVLDKVMVKTGRRSWDNTTSPGVSVQVLDTETGEPTERAPFDVPNRYIRDTWQGHLDKAAAARASREKSAQNMAARHAAQAEVNQPIIAAIKAKVPGLNQQSFSPPYLAEGIIDRFERGEITKLELDATTLAALLGTDA